jgi:hypothetical protein
MPTLISGSTGVNKITDGTIVDADINASAAIAGTKLVMPAGSILQVVTGTHTGQVVSTSTTYADTGLDANITPSSTSSKILIQATLVSCYNNSVNKQGTFRIMRDDTTNLTPYPDSGEQGHIGVTYCPGEKINSTITFMFEDSPSSTSALNYSIYMAVQSGGDMRMNQNGQRSYIHLMEVAG